jgi:sulfopyruvate decarboxylase TPP-binding subunit
MWNHQMLMMQQIGLYGQTNTYDSEYITYVLLPVLQGYKNKHSEQIANQSPCGAKQYMV